MGNAVLFCFNNVINYAINVINVIDNKKNDI